MKKLSLTVALVCLVGIAFGQGSLTPPGAPGATMKTLLEIDTAITGVSNAVEQVEARIDLATISGDAESHHLITAPGSYYLSGNLAVSKSNGITISSSDVTLDLNGYTLSAWGGYAIFVASGADRAIIQNGKISGFLYAVVGSFDTPRPEHCLIKNLSISDSRTHGIAGSIHWMVMNCQTYNVSATGIFLGSNASVINCEVYGSGGLWAIQTGSDSLVSRCIVRASDSNKSISTSHGSRVERCIASGNTNETGVIYAGRGSVVSQCTVRDNQSPYGIYADYNSEITGCNVSYNQGTGAESYGIHTTAGSSVMSCTVGNNSNTNSPTTSSQGVGIRAVASTVKDCVVSYNSGDGILASSDCYLTANQCRANGYSSGDGAGIHATSADNRIDGNNLLDNDRGIDVDSGGNLIVRNSASGNANNYDIAANNDTGTITNTPVGAGAWDNFDF